MAWIAGDNETSCNGTGGDLVLQSLIESQLSMIEKYKDAYMSLLRNSSKPELQTKVKHILDILAEHVRELKRQQADTIV